MFGGICMGEKLPWILWGGGAAVILVSCWCRVLLDIDKTWFIIAVVIGLAMVAAGKFVHKSDDSGKQ